MKTAIWNVAPLLALLTLAAPPVSARASQTIAEKAVDKTKEGLSKTGEVITDGWITSRVHERFITEDLLKGSDISVKTRKHVVTLTGTVVGRAGRAKATSIALNTEGVHRVVNRLSISAKHAN